MSKNVLIITGSPRKGGNSDTLAAAFMEGAREAGNTAEIFSAAANPVLPCRACDACWNKGEACAFDDGFRILAPMLQKADVIVFATPLYWFSFSSQIKAAIDKMYSFMSNRCDKKLHIEKAYMIVSAEAENEQEEFDGIVASFKLICDYMQWTQSDVLIADGLGAKDAIKAKQYFLEQAKHLGKNV